MFADRRRNGLKNERHKRQLCAVAGLKIDLIPCAEFRNVRHVDLVNARHVGRGLFVAEIVTRYVKRLKSAERKPLHQDIVNITGLVPRQVDAETEHRQHLLDKHR